MLKRDLSEEIGKRVGNRIATAWLVRAMLAKHGLSMEGLESLAREFPMVEAKSINKHSIAHARDALADVAKDLAGGHATAQLENEKRRLPDGVGAPFTCLHIHDEAAMRMR
jgi:hypothetical protein